MTCQWCQNPATTRIVVEPGKKKTVKGKDAYSGPITAPVCHDCGKRLAARYGVGA